MADLAVELDLHYEDGDRAAIQDSLDKLATAANVLNANGLKVPDVCTHVQERFQGTWQ
ncbi:hypothetical protein [Devosia sp. Naph2]|uniref:hypothetical protein n=1 Tax=Devosia polycyclovorans TaxID=3345148 RepID=UPI0035CF98F5